jgi:hypothetical protein
MKLTPEQREMVSLVQRVDSWSQENYPYVDKQFSQLYSGEEGWEGVFKVSPSRFYRAYALALDYQEAANKDGFY